MFFNVSVLTSPSLKGKKLLGNTSPVFDTKIPLPNTPSFRVLAVLAAGVPGVLLAGAKPCVSGISSKNLSSFDFRIW